MTIFAGPPRTHASAVPVGLAVRAGIGFLLTLRLGVYTCLPSAVATVGALVTVGFPFSGAVQTGEGNHKMPGLPCPAFCVVNAEPGGGPSVDVSPYILRSSIAKSGQASCRPLPGRPREKSLVFALVEGGGYLPPSPALRSRRYPQLSSAFLQYSKHFFTSAIVSMPGLPYSYSMLAGIFQCLSRSSCSTATMGVSPWPKGRFAP